ncbi:histidine phosphatase family protein [Pseudorhodoplanes sp.]|uniref:histidine phosphatase family protein n=1 Tax=Pseudorhodoplanes sp. TaxID=1934341 RepID=UPI00391B7D4A
MLRLWAVLALLAVFPTVASADVWAVLNQPGVIALIRHADAPGVGDPKGWRLDDCSTQRNLSERGRREARALGEAFRANGIVAAKVIASQWCRAVDTATLMQIGPVEQSASFNNAYVLFDKRAELTHAARGVLAAWSGEGLLVVVSHGDNIALLTGVMPAQGEIVAVRRVASDPGRLTVIGRIKSAGARVNSGATVAAGG